MKKEDFILVTVLDGQKVLALRPDYFDEKPVTIEEKIKEVFETKEAKDIEMPPPESGPTEEELAEIERLRKIDVLKSEYDAKLAALD